MPTKLHSFSLLGFWITLLLLLFILSGWPYNLLAPFYPPANLLIVQQLLPIIVVLGLTVILRKHFFPLPLQKLDWLLIGLILIAALAAHAAYLNQYFFKEDIAIEIGGVAAGTPGGFPVTSARLYPLATFSLLYLVGGGQALLFTSVGLAFHLLNAVLLFILLVVAARNRAVAVATALLWAASPAFLEGFAWLGVGVGSGTAIFIALWVLILFAAALRQDRKDARIPLFLTIGVLAAVNAGFVRTGMLPFLLPLLVWVSTKTSPAPRGSFWPRLKRFWLPITLGVLAVIYLFSQTISWEVGGANVLGNRPLSLGAFATTFFTITGALFPPQVQEFLATRLATADGSLHTIPWYAFHLILAAEILLPLVIIALARDKVVRAIGLFGWLWFVISLVPMVIGGGALENYADVYRATLKFPYLPGLKQIHFAYIGYAVALSAALWVLFSFLKGVWRRILYRIAVGGIAVFFALTSNRYHGEFAAYYSQPLKTLVAIINARALPQEEYLLVFAPNGSPVNSFLSGGKELPFLTQHKKVLYTRDPQEAQELLGTYGVREGNVIALDYDTQTGAVSETLFRGFR